ncbi:sterol carrier family protein [Actinomycetaceae bacterium MB13-C1-2]|nr:sterol carrier family protein [Actinomycetaceae bacterium MB13-C1-2]
MLTSTNEDEAIWREYCYNQGRLALSRDQKAAAVRYSLAELERLHPGRSVEVRVVPFAAVQIIAGAAHRRGTPPAVVEMDGETWLELASGRLTWEEADEAGRVDASGERSNLSGLLPL